MYISAAESCVMCLIKWPTHVFIVHNTVVCDQIPGCTVSLFAPIELHAGGHGKGVSYLSFLLISTFPLPTTADKQSPVQKVTDSTGPNPLRNAVAWSTRPWTRPASSSSPWLPLRNGAACLPSGPGSVRLINGLLLSSPWEKRFSAQTGAKRISLRLRCWFFLNELKFSRWQQAVIDANSCSREACHNTLLLIVTTTPHPPHKRRRNTICLLWGLRGTFQVPEVR